MRTGHTYPDWAMLAKDFHQQDWFPRRMIVQPKLNGVRAKWDHRLNLFISRQGMVFPRHVIPHLYDLMLKYKYHFSLDGELYCWELPFQEICGLLAQNRIEKSGRIELLGFHVFDYIGPDSARYRADTIQKASEYFDKVSSEELYCTEAAINLALRATTTLGYEGIMLRTPHIPYIVGRTEHLLKVKAPKYEQVKIIGFIEGEGKYKDCVGAFTIELPNKLVLNIGGARIFTDDRRHIWKHRDDFMHKVVTIEYYETSVKGVPLKAQIIYRHELFPTS